ncbi:MAG: hypothetical protein FJZ95_06595 [Chloroflexi bacterium]|nr:hypothetical protein [Chloroflexota bacterium]
MSQQPQQGEPISGDLFTERDFWPQFIEDIKNVKSRLVILSPFLSIRRSGMLMEYFQAMIQRGVELCVYTRPKSQQTSEMASQAEIVIEQLKGIGAAVIERRSMHQKVALLDGSVAWEGSLNILSHRDTGEQMRRFEGQSSIHEIARCLDLDGAEVTSNIPNLQCPICGSPLVMRRGKYGKFFSYSKYPDCKGRLNLGRGKGVTVDQLCSECGRPMVMRQGKKGPFLGCSGYPACTSTVNL